MTLAYSALFQATALAAPTMLSSDLFGYVMHGRILAVHGGNPYLEPASRYAADPFIEHLYWAFETTLYGPLWILISASLAWLAGDDVGRAVLLFRGLAAAALTTALAALLAERLDRPHAITGLLLLGWNPLVVVEAVLSGHNDFVMMLCVVAGLAWAANCRTSLALAAVVLGGLVKFVTLALLPLLGLVVLRQRASWRKRALLIGRAASLSVALTILIVVSVWGGPGMFAAGELATGGERYINSLAEVVRGEIRVLLGDSRGELAVPASFVGWWVASHTPTALRSRPDEGADELRTLPIATHLIAAGPERDGWLRVYEPESRLVGYVLTWTLGPADRPAAYGDDPEVLARERGPAGSRSVQTANLTPRLIGWGSFAVAWLGAAVWATSSLDGLLRGWLIVLLILFYLGSGWFWPWYAVWGVSLAAMEPASWPARWMFALSWGVLLLYAGVGFGGTHLWYLEAYRSVAVFGLPLLMLGALEVVRRRASTVAAPQPDDLQPGPSRAAGASVRAP